MSNKRGISIGTVKRIHFVGIGGIGMSALARLFLFEKKKVSGSDRTPSLITKKLGSEGATIYESQVKENITDDIELVVYTEAMPKDHEELLAAKEKRIPTINYFDALGLVANQYYLIAVAGTHGKTTTTAMIADILEEADFDPTVIVGSLRGKTQSNFRAGKSKYMVVEACEYKRDFLSLTPDMLVITNIEYDHVDYFKDLKDVQEAFRELAAQVREEGTVILNFGGDNTAHILEGLTVPIVDYGNYFDPTLKLKQPGVHNMMNAAAATAVADKLGIERDVSKKALESFVGTWRRFEYKGTLNGAPLYDDYAHHPTEIEATLKATRELYKDKKIWVVFQSHTYSRTHELFDDFAGALSLADEALILPIYAAREENISGVSHSKLADAINGERKNARAIDTFEEAASLLKEQVTENDVVIVMGAGSITHMADMLITQNS